MMSSWSEVVYNDNGDLLAPDFLISAENDELFLCVRQRIIHDRLYDRRKMVLNAAGITRTDSCITHVCQITWPERMP
jgi:hypothetical protein